MIQQDECFAIRGALYEVYNTLGPGFTEYVYQDALEKELTARLIPFQREVRFLAKYKGEWLAHDYYVDFVCFGNITVECKAVEKLNGIHKAQILNYLRMSGFKIGILVNFGNTEIEIKTLINNHLINDDCSNPTHQSND